MAKKDRNKDPGVTERRGPEPTRVEDLKHFPCKDFAELKQWLDEGLANLSVRRMVAIQSLHATSGWQTKKTVFWGFVFITSPLIFLGYVIVVGEWLWLLALPVLFIGALLYHPGVGKLIGYAQHAVVALTVGSLIWGLLAGIDWLAAVALTLTVIWYAEQTFYSRAVAGLVHIALQHEEVFCKLWFHSEVDLVMRNGDTYSHRWKSEGDRDTCYKDPQP